VTGVQTCALPIWLSFDVPLEEWRESVLGQGLYEIPLDGATALRAGTLADGLHGDPGDRMIVATALMHGCTLVTADQDLLSWPGMLERVDART
jgi:PIN domain nuclease of toxin-antitoxin system